jgi:hypothetical protein
VIKYHIITGVAVRGDICSGEDTGDSEVGRANAAITLWYRPAHNAIMTPSAITVFNRMTCPTAMNITVLITHKKE